MKGGFAERVDAFIWALRYPKQDDHGYYTATGGTLIIRETASRHDTQNMDDVVHLDFTLLETSGVRRDREWNMLCYLMGEEVYNRPNSDTLYWKRQDTELFVYDSVSNSWQFKSLQEAERVVLLLQAENRNKKPEVITPKRRQLSLED